MNRREAILSPLAVAASAVAVKAEELNAEVQVIEPEPLMLIISCKHDAAYHRMHDELEYFTKYYPELKKLPILITIKGDYKFQVVSNQKGPSCPD